MKAIIEIDTSTADEKCDVGGSSEIEAFKKLTVRQREVLLLICDGLSAKEISSRLNIGSKTVEFHKAAMYHALGLHSTAHLVRYAIRTGLLQP